MPLDEMPSCTKGMLSHFFVACDFTVCRSCKMGGTFQIGSFISYTDGSFGAIKQ